MKEEQVFPTGTEKLVVSLLEDRPNDWSVRISDGSSNFTMFPVHDKLEGQMRARFVALLVERLVLKPKRRRRAPKQSRWWYVVKQRALEAHQTFAVLDNLRYDGATVDAGGAPDYWLLSKDASAGRPMPNEERWRSYHIKIYVIKKSTEPPTAEEISRYVEQEDRLIEKIG